MEKRKKRSMNLAHFLQGRLASEAISFDLLDIFNEIELLQACDRMENDVKFFGLHLLYYLFFASPWYSQFLGIGPQGGDLVQNVTESELGEVVGVKVAAPVAAGSAGSHNSSSSMTSSSADVTGPGQSGLSSGIESEVISSGATTLPGANKSPPPVAHTVLGKDEKNRIQQAVRKWLLHEHNIELKPNQRPSLAQLKAFQVAQEKCKMGRVLSFLFNRILSQHADFKIWFHARVIVDEVLHERNFTAIKKFHLEADDAGGGGESANGDGGPGTGGGSAPNDYAGPGPGVDDPGATTGGYQPSQAVSGRPHHGVRLRQTMVRQLCEAAADSNISHAHAHNLLSRNKSVDQDQRALAVERLLIESESKKLELISEYLFKVLILYEMQCHIACGGIVQTGRILELMELTIQWIEERRRRKRESMEQRRSSRISARSTTSKSSQATIGRPMRPNRASLAEKHKMHSVESRVSGHSGVTIKNLKKKSKTTDANTGEDQWLTAIPEDSDSDEWPGGLAAAKSKVSKPQGSKAAALANEKEESDSDSDEWPTGLAVAKSKPKVESKSKPGAPKTKTKSPPARPAAAANKTQKRKTKRDSDEGPWLTDIPEDTDSDDLAGVAGHKARPSAARAEASNSDSDSPDSYQSSGDEGHTVEVAIASRVSPTTVASGRVRSSSFKKTPTDFGPGPVLPVYKSNTLDPTQQPRPGDGPNSSVSMEEHRVEEGYTVPSSANTDDLLNQVVPEPENRATTTVGFGALKRSFAGTTGQFQAHSDRLGSDSGAGSETKTSLSNSMQQPATIAVGGTQVSQVSVEKQPEAAPGVGVLTAEQSPQLPAELQPPPGPATVLVENDTVSTKLPLLTKKVTVNFADESDGNAKLAGPGPVAGPVAPQTSPKPQLPTLDFDPDDGFSVSSESSEDSDEEDQTVALADNSGNVNISNSQHNQRLGASFATFEFDDAFLVFPLRVKEVAEQSPADEAGLVPEMELKSVNDIPILDCVVADNDYSGGFPGAVHRISDEHVVGTRLVQDYQLTDEHLREVVADFKQIRRDLEILSDVKKAGMHPRFHDMELAKRKDIKKKLRRQYVIRRDMLITGTSRVIPIMEFAKLLNERPLRLMFRRPGSSAKKRRKYYENICDILAWHVNKERVAPPSNRSGKSMDPPLCRLQKPVLGKGIGAYPTLSNREAPKYSDIVRFNLRHRDTCRVCFFEIVSMNSGTANLSGAETGSEASGTLSANSTPRNLNVPGPTVGTTTTTSCQSSSYSLSNCLLTLPLELTLYQVRCILDCLFGRSQMGRKLDRNLFWVETASAARLRRCHVTLASFARTGSLNRYSEATNDFLRRCQTHPEEVAAEYAAMDAKRDIRKKVLNEMAKLYQLLTAGGLGGQAALGKKLKGLAKRWGYTVKPFQTYRREVEEDEASRIRRGKRLKFSKGAARTGLIKLRRAVGKLREAGFRLKKWRRLERMRRRRSTVNRATDFIASESESSEKTADLQSGSENDPMNQGVTLNSDGTPRRLSKGKNGKFKKKRLKKAGGTKAAVASAVGRSSNAVLHSVDPTDLKQLLNSQFNGTVTGAENTDSESDSSSSSSSSSDQNAEFPDSDSSDDEEYKQTLAAGKVDRKNFYWLRFGVVPPHEESFVTLWDLYRGQIKDRIPKNDFHWLAFCPKAG